MNWIKNSISTHRENLNQLKDTNHELLGRIGDLKLEREELMAASKSHDEDAKISARSVELLENERVELRGELAESQDELHQKSIDFESTIATLMDAKQKMEEENSFARGELIKMKETVANLEERREFWEPRTTKSRNFKLQRAAKAALENRLREGQNKIDQLEETKNNLEKVLTLEQLRRKAFETEAAANSVKIEDLVVDLEQKCVEMAERDQNAKSKIDKLNQKCAEMDEHKRDMLEQIGKIKEMAKKERENIEHEKEAIMKRNKTEIKDLKLFFTANKKKLENKIGSMVTEQKEAIIALGSENKKKLSALEDERNMFRDKTYKLQKLVRKFDNLKLETEQMKGILEQKRVQEKIRQERDRKSIYELTEKINNMKTKFRAAKDSRENEIAQVRIHLDQLTVEKDDFSQKYENMILENKELETKISEVTLSDEHRKIIENLKEDITNSKITLQRARQLHNTQIGQMRNEIEQISAERDEIEMVAEALRFNLRGAEDATNRIKCDFIKTATVLKEIETRSDELALARAHELQELRRHIKKNDDDGERKSEEIESLKNRIEADKRREKIIRQKNRKLKEQTIELKSLQITKKAIFEAENDEKNRKISELEEKLHNDNKSKDEKIAMLEEKCENDNNRKDEQIDELENLLRDNNSEKDQIIAELEEMLQTLDIECSNKNVQGGGICGNVMIKNEVSELDIEIQLCSEQLMNETLQDDHGGVENKIQKIEEVQKSEEFSNKEESGDALMIRTSASDFGLPQHETSSLFVAGNFSDWSPVEMVPSGGDEYSVRINFEKFENKHFEEQIEFKFLIDGNWLASSRYATVCNRFGSLNNVI